MEGKTFAVYSDESGIFDHRFQTIAVVTGPEIVLTQLKSSLKDILDKYQINEVKFVEIRRSQSRKAKAARKFLQCAVKEFASQAKARIDVLIWDTQDSRHAIQGRDDIANLERMYYKVLIHTARQWNQTEWNFHPDENSQIHWNEIIEFLNRTRIGYSKPNLLTLFESDDAKQLFQFGGIKQLNSLQEPLIQLADLFAGMARFTREEGEQCIQWIDSWGNKAQLQFLHLLDREDETTRTKISRFQIVRGFNNLCKRHRMGVSLREKRCLWTPNPTNPINFWNYEPQHEYDKAPKRIGR